MNKELLKVGLKSFFIVPLILTIVLILTGPVYVLIQKSVIDESATSFEQIDSTAASLEEPVDLNMTGAYKELAGATIIYNPYVMLTILILPIVLGVQLFGNSIKHKNRLADYIKEKGLDKRTVYKTNVTTGIILSIVPIVVTALLLLIIKLFAGMGNYITAKTLINWTVLGITSSILFFVLTSVISLITKSRPLQVLYTYGLLFIPIFVVYLFEIVLTQIIYGFPGFSFSIIELLNQIPAVKVIQTFTSGYVNYTISHLWDLWYSIVYVIISGLIIFVGYKLITVEKQEKLQNIGNKIFKYMWIFIIGSVLYVAFKINYTSPLIAIIITVAVLLIIYIIKELAKNKNIKCILNGKRYYIASGVVIIFVILMSSNLFGYEDKIPELQDIEYMTYTVAYPNKIGEIEFRNEENINLLIEKHKNWLLEKNTVKDITTDQYTKVYLQYKLKNGKSIIRSYETVLTMEDAIFNSQEYVEQKYSYMYEEKESIDILQIAGIYNNKTFVLEVNRYENLDILNELVSYISNDLTNYDVHIPASGEYQQYSEKDGIQVLQINVLDGISEYSSYLYYLKVNTEYELVKKLQTLIDENSEFIIWYETEEESVLETNLENDSVIEDNNQNNSIVEAE